MANAIGRVWLPSPKTIQRWGSSQPSLPIIIVFLEKHIDTVLTDRHMFTRLLLFFISLAEAHLIVEEAVLAVYEGHNVFPECASVFFIIF